MLGTVPCPVAFETMDYKPLTDVCKAPDYDAKACCDGIKAIACPYDAQVNDGGTDCAFKMMYYIHMAGNYPEGLFYRKCYLNPDIGDVGMECP